MCLVYAHIKCNAVELGIEIIPARDGEQIQEHLLNSRIMADCCASCKCWRNCLRNLLDLGLLGPLEPQIQGLFVALVCVYDIVLFELFCLVLSW